MKVNYIGIACMAVLLLTACDESKYELEITPVRKISHSTIRGSLILMPSPFIKVVATRH